MSTIKLQTMSRLQSIHQANRNIPGHDDRSLEALELCNDFASELGIHIDDARPCIALLYDQGVTSERDNYAFTLMLELKCIDVRSDLISQALITFSNRLLKPLPRHTIRKFERKIEDKRYHTLHRCDHAHLRLFCIDRENKQNCPWAKLRMVGSKKPTANAVEFTKLGWLSYIDNPYHTHIYLALLRMRAMGYYSANAIMSFNYSMLERLSGINRRNITKALRALEAMGLVKNLSIGSSWGQKRRRTRLTIVDPIPDPVILGHNKVFE